jgi:esterase/lipase
VHLDILSAPKHNGINILKLPGLPSFPKENNFTRFCQEAGFNVFIPHYLGSWLSDGLFTPENCLKTAKLSIKFIKKQRGIELYNHEEKRWSNRQIILCGSSFGGWVASKLCSISKIKKCALFAPLIDIKNQGKINTEEKLSHTLQFIREVFKNGFRGIEKNKWELFFAGDLNISSVDIIKLSNKELFICHGTADPTINIAHTRNFLKDLRKTNSSIQYYEINEATHKIWDYLDKQLLSRFASWALNAR